MGSLGRLLLVVLGFLLGATTGLAVVMLHQSWLWLGVGGVATLAVLMAPPPGGWVRLPYALGWLAILVTAALGRPEGDYVLSAEAHGNAVLLGGLLVLIGATLASVTRGTKPAL